MSALLTEDGMAEELLRELRRPSPVPVCGEELIDAVVDAMAQAHLTMESVTLDEVKCLLAGVIRQRVRFGRRRPRLVAV